MTVDPRFSVRKSPSVTAEQWSNTVVRIFIDILCGNGFGKFNNNYRPKCKILDPDGTVKFSVRASEGHEDRISNRSETDVDVAFESFPRRAKYVKGGRIRNADNGG